MTTSAEWSEHVAARRASGLSAEAFCKDKPFSTKSLWGWSSKFKKAASTQEAAGATHVPLARIVARASVATSASPGTASVVFATAKGRLEVHGQVARPARSGALFVFFGRRKSALKILFFDGSGMCLFYKRLDDHTFRVPSSPVPGAACIELNERELDELLDAIAVDTKPDPSPSRRPRIH